MVISICNKQPQEETRKEIYHYQLQEEQRWFSKVSPTPRWCCILTLTLKSILSKVFGSGGQRWDADRLSTGCV